MKLQNSIYTFLTFMIVLFSFLIIGAFFMPWVHGEGSVAKPFEGIVSAFDKVDPTTLINRFFKMGKGVVDQVVHHGAGIELKQSASGFTLPALNNKDVENARPAIYTLYALPVVAGLFVILICRKKRMRIKAGVICFLSLVFVIILGTQLPLFSKETIFVRLQAGIGYYVTLISSAAISTLAGGRTLMKKE